MVSAIGHFNKHFLLQAASADITKEDGSSFFEISIQFLLRLPTRAPKISSYLANSIDGDRSRLIVLSSLASLTAAANCLDTTSGSSLAKSLKSVNPHMRCSPVNPGKMATPA